MAAPLSAYSNNKLPISGSTTTTLPLALNLSGYTNIKNHFYLDKVFRVEDDFIGMVKSGSTNYTYHNPNRFSKVRLKDESNGDVYLLCNDGGLNTIPVVKNVTTSSDYLFSLKAQAQFNSSYYSTTTTYGFRGRQRNPSNTAWEGWNVVYQDYDYGTIPANDYIVIESYGFSSDRKGVDFEIQPLATNEEGTYYGDSVFIFPKAKSITFYGDPTTYYIDTPEVMVGTKVYYDEDFGVPYNTPLTLGIEPLKYWIYGYDVWTDTYMVLEYRDDTPVIPVEPPKLEYIAYSDISEGDAANQVIYDLRYHSGTIWFDSDNNLWWVNWSESSGFFDVPLDGWYANGTVAGVDQIIYIIGGIEQ